MIDEQTKIHWRIYIGMGKHGRERERERLNKKIILSFSNTLQYLLLVAVYRSKLTNFFR